MCLQESHALLQGLYGRIKPAHPLLKKALTGQQSAQQRFFGGIADPRLPLDHCQAEAVFPLQKPAAHIIKALQRGKRRF